MSSIPILEQLPATFAVERTSRGAWAVRRDCEAELRAVGFGLEADGATRASELAGRAALETLETERGVLVLRRFTHGGLLRWLTGRRFLDAERPFRELLCSERLTQHGVPTPEVVAARARRLIAGGWELALVTRRVEGVVDGGEVLDRITRGELGARARTRLLGAAGRLVRRLHDLGFLHADLHPRNLLFELECDSGDEPRVWVLDLDRSVWREQLAERERLTNLRRMLRYVARRQREGRWRVSATDVARFLVAYDAGRERWKDDWRQIRDAHDRAHAFHAPGWELERRFRGPR